MHAFTLVLSYIYGLVALLDNIQSSFSSITMSTGYEPGARCNLYYDYSIYISRSRASKTLNHPRTSLFVTVATAAHKHTKTQHHYHRHHLLHTSTMSTFTMITENLQERLRSYPKSYLIFVHSIPSDEHLPVKYHPTIAYSIHGSIPHT